MAKSKRRKNIQSNGRQRTARFVGIAHSVLSTAAYRGLSPTARSLMFELAMIENGRNNGSIILSRADAAARMGVSDLKAAGSAFEELQERGFIALAKDAHFRVKTGERRAREWRLTWLAVPGKSGPTNNFQNWQPCRTDARAAKRADAGLRALARLKKVTEQNENAGEDSPFMNSLNTEIAGLAREDSPPIIIENDGNPPIGQGGESPLHTVVHGKAGGAQTLTFAQLDVLNSIVAPGAQSGKQDGGSDRARAAAATL